MGADVLCPASRGAHSHPPRTATRCAIRRVDGRTADRNPMVGTVVAAILDALDLELPPLPAPGEPGFYSFSNGEVLEAAFAAAGFDEVDVEPFEIEYEYSSGG